MSDQKKQKKKTCYVLRFVEFLEENSRKFSSQKNKISTPLFTGVLSDTPQEQRSEFLIGKWVSMEWNGI